MLLLCCNLLSIAEVGLLNCRHHCGLLWLGVSICLIAVIAGHAKAEHAADNWIEAIGPKERPEEMRVKRSQKSMKTGILPPRFSGLARLPSH